ncbi:MAG: hypothetical protein V7603_5071 [Micromonosporaceae bacterium]
MCTPWDTSCLATEVAVAVSNSVFGQAAQVIVTAEQWLIDISASWWVMVPSIGLYPNRGNTDPNAIPIDAVARLHALILPITMVIAVGGMMWNGLLMVLSRKPAPLVNVLRGLWNTSLWSAVGVFGTNLLLAGTDAFANYVLTSALKSVGEPSLGKRLASLVVPVLNPGGMPVGLVILISSVAMTCALIQAMLMLFRDGAVLILAPMTTLAAAGSFTNATSGWLRKIVAWLLTLIFYKDCAAMAYAVMIWMTGENSSRDPRVLLFGVAMMIVALAALPVLLRFFNWTVGTLQPGGGGLGMLASAGAAGMHAASSLRGVGGSSVNDHARYLGEMFDRGSSPGGPGDARPSAAGPSGLGPGRGGGGLGPGGGPGAPPGPAGDLKPPVFRGEAGPGKVSNITSAGGGSAPAGGAGAGSAAATTGAGAGAGASAGAGTSAALGASAAAGPAAPIVAGAVVVTGAVTSTVKAAANTAAAAAADSTKSG